MAKIINPTGREIPAAEIQRVRNRALIGSGGAPYDAADRTSSEMAGWNAVLGAPDVETQPNRDLAVARIRDMVRNDGWASGTVTRMTDAVVGADFRLSALPDYRALARRSNAAFDATWAREFRLAAEAGFRSWAEDPARWCDVARKHTFSQKARLAFRHYLVEGEACGPIPWRPERVGYGRARYATCMQLIDPDRLSNPNGLMDTDDIRGGVEVDADDAPIAYHIRGAHQGEWWAAERTVTWERIERETSWGRQQFVHHYDADRAGDHRPIGGIFAPVLARMRMLAQYDRLEVQAAIINAIFGAFVESPYDSADVQKALSGEDEDGEGLSAYQRMRADFHEDSRLSVGSVRLAKLFPGESIKTVSSSRPAGAFDMFEAAMLRNLATATGNSFETVSANYRGASYSGARQSLLEAWRTLTRRRVDFGRGWATPHWVCLLEEMIDRGDVPMPAGAPDFPEIRAELSRCRWIGPGRGWVDPTKEPEGSKMKIAAGLSTLEREAAENDGLDWEEVLDQRQLEEEAARARGLNLTFAVTGGEQATPSDAGEKPEGSDT